MQAVKPDNKTFLAGISEGRAGTKQTLRAMTQLVKTYKKVPDIREQACNIVISAGVLPKDFTGEIVAIFNWCRDNIHYIQDIADVETIQTPDYTLYHKWGDCDDVSTLLATLLESVNHKTRFRAVGFQENVLEHVYVETLIGASFWLPLDATENVEAGWQPDESTIVEKMYSHN